MTSLFSRGINCILVIPDHVVKCHPFIRRYFLDVSRNEENDGEGDSCGTDEDVDDDASSTEQTISRIATATADRRRAFVADDRADDRAEAEPTANYATKTSKVNSDGVSQKTAVADLAVQEHGTVRNRKTIRFL